MKKNRTALIVSFLFIIATAAPGAFTGIYVERWDGSDWVDAAADSGHNRNAGQSGYSYGSDISVVTSGNGLYRVFAVAGTTQNIGVITVTGDGDPDLMVGRDTDTPPALLSTEALEAQGCNRLEAIVSDGVSLDVQLFVGEIWGTGQGGSEFTYVDRVIRVDAGSVTGYVYVNEKDADLETAGGHWYLDSFSSTGLIQVSRGRRGGTGVSGPIGSPAGWHRSLRKPAVSH